jgi:hypothetical protein
MDIDDGLGIFDLKPDKFGKFFPDFSLLGDGFLMLTTIFFLIEFLTVFPSYL